jgi:hypothetical protein
MSILKGLLKTANKVQSTYNTVAGLANSVDSVISGLEKLNSKFDSRIPDIYASGTGFDPKGKSPEEIRAERAGITSGANTFVFPSDLAKYYIKLSFWEYKKDSITLKGTKKPSGTVALPMPQNLAEAYGIDVGQQSLGVEGYIVQQNPVNFDFNELGKMSAAEVASAIGSKLSAGLTAAGDQISGIAKNQMNATARVIAQSLMNDSGIGTAVSQQLGSVLNPHMTAAFNGVSLRSHQFTWRLSPNSQAENAEIQRMLRFIRQRTHPDKDFGGFFLTYPDEIRPEFGPVQDMPFKFKPCLCSGLSINHAPNGPAFMRDGKPAEYDLSISLLEIDYWTRGDF